MSFGGLTVLDGTTLRDIELCLPHTDGAVTGAQLVTIAETETSSPLRGVSLPETVKCNALKRINIKLTVDLDRDEAELKLKEYVIAVADELRDDPIVVSVLDGSSLRLFLEDEDDFAMLAENLFTDLDVVDKGKIKKSEIRNALVHMGVDLGVPPFSEFSLLEDILKKHKAEGEEELGQAQFAESLQPVLQDLADALAEKHVVVIQNIKISNGSKLRKVLADEEQLKKVINKILVPSDDKDERGSRKTIRQFLETNGPLLGLPLLEANDAVAILYDQVFSEIPDEQPAGDLDSDKFAALVKDIFEKLAEQLEVNPIFQGLDN